MDADIHAQANFGFVVSGSVIPPKITEFAITTGIDADVDTALVIQASASVRNNSFHRTATILIESLDVQNTDLSTGDISLFTLGLPGLDIPGYVALGFIFLYRARLSITIVSSLSGRSSS